MMNMERKYVRVLPVMKGNHTVGFTCNVKIGDKLVYQKASGYTHLHFPKKVTVVGDYPYVLLLKCDTNIMCANKASIFNRDDILYVDENP